MQERQFTENGRRWYCNKNTKRVALSLDGMANGGWQGGKETVSAGGFGGNPTGGRKDSHLCPMAVKRL